MIELLDPAISVYIKSLFLNWTVVMGLTDEEESRQALAGSGESDNHAGIPGLSVWRSACPKDRQVGSIPQAAQGYTGGLQASNYKFDQIKMVRALPEYTVVAWTATLKDRNHAERTLSFADVHSQLEGQFITNDEHGVEMRVPFKTSIQGSDPVYGYWKNPKNARPVLYSIQYTFQARSYWGDFDTVPQILKIKNDFCEYEPGTPVGDNLLKSILIVPK